VGGFEVGLDGAKGEVTTMFSRAIQSRWRGLGPVVLGALLCCAGCTSQERRSSTQGWLGQGGDSKKRQQNEIDPTRIETRDDIFEIVQFWPQLPWLQKGNRVVGFKVTVYFRSGETELGAFVPGNICVWLHVLEPRAGGGREARLAHTWEFDQLQSVRYRVTRRAIGGYYYGFPLIWPTDLELEGKLIQIQFGYERGDGRIVRSEPRQFRVPVPIGYQPAAEEAGD